MKFKVGNWYRSKRYPSLYIKVLQLNNLGNCILSSVIWSIGQFSAKNNSEDYPKFWEKLNNLQEIQKYLPENHPDKFDYNNTRYFKYVDLDGTFIKGKIYKLREGKKIDSYCPFINERGEIDGYNNMKDTKWCFIPSTEEEYNKQNAIKIKKNMKKFKNRLTIIGSKSLLKAFAEELDKIGHIRDKSIFGDFEKHDLESILIYKEPGFSFTYGAYSHSNLSNSIELYLPKDWDLALKLAAEIEEEVPEYVECIDPGYFISGFSKTVDKLIRGKIYKVSSKEPQSSYDKKLVIETESGYAEIGCSSGETLYKPSTKEAYEAQFKLKPEVGKWYKLEDSNEDLFYVTSVNNKGVCYGYGLTGGVWEENLVDNSIYCICNEVAFKRAELATNKEVEEILLAYAKQKYPIGTTIKGLYTQGISANMNCNKKIKLEGNYTIQNFRHKDGIAIYASPNVYLYNQGKWAEITEDKVEVNDYSVEKINHIQVKVGCQIFDRWMLESVIVFLNEYGGHYEAKDGSHWNVDQIKKVLSVFDE